MMLQTFKISVDILAGKLSKTHVQYVCLSFIPFLMLHSYMAGFTFLLQKDCKEKVSMESDAEELKDEETNTETTRVKGRIFVSCKTALSVTTARGEWVSFT